MSGRMGWRPAEVALVTLGAIVALFVLANFGLELGLIVPYGASTNNKGCNANNECMVSWIQGQPASCRYDPAPTTKRCTGQPQCYAASTPLHCDGGPGGAAPQCVSDNATACLGLCPYADYQGYLYQSSAACTPDLFPLSLYFASQFSPGPGDTNEILFPAQNNWVEPLPYGQPFCLAQVCTLAFVQATSMVFSGSPVTWQLASGNQISCLGMLNQTAAQTPCITAKEVPLSDTYMKQFYTSGALATTGRMCIYSYACAQLNLTSLELIENVD